MNRNHVWKGEKEMAQEQKKRRSREKNMLRIRIVRLHLALNELGNEEHDALTVDNYEAVLKEESCWIERARKALKPLP